MYKTVLAALAALMVAPASAAAQDASAEVLDASTNWNLDYGNEHCELRRTFGSGPAAVTLYLRQSLPGQFFDVVLSGDRFGKPRPAFGTTAYYGNLVKRHLKDSVWITQASNGSPVLLIGSTTFAESKEKAETNSRVTDTDLNAITTMRFDVPKLSPFTLATGPMQPPMAALTNCLCDLVRTWGFDPDNAETFSLQPTLIGSASRWIDPTKYPKALLNERQGALLQLRLVVGPDGKVEDCAIQNLVGEEAFAKLTCESIKEKAKFRPAMNAKKQPVRSLWFQRVAFQVL